MTEEQKQNAILYNGLYQEEIDSFENLPEDKQKEVLEEAKAKVQEFEKKHLVEMLGGEKILAFIFCEGVGEIEEEDLERVFQERFSYIDNARKFFQKPESEELFLKYGVLDLDESGNFLRNETNISSIIENEGFQINLDEEQETKKEVLNLWKNNKIFPSEDFLNEQSKERNGIGFKEFLFCEEYLKQGKITSTAKTLGIGRTTCYEYLKKKEVQDYLKERREEIRKENDELLQTGFFNCFEELQSLITKEYIQNGERIKAIDCYLRHYEQSIYKNNEISQ